MKKVFAYFVFWMFLPAGIFAQDIHFSQFTEHTSLVNPALTGVQSPIRASAGFRNQWNTVASPYVTEGISYEMRFRPGNWEQVDKTKGMTFRQRSIGRVAAGISVYNDNAGTGSMKQTLANLSLATFIPLSSTSFISVGLQGRLVQKRLNTNNLVFPNQYNGSSYSSALNSGEAFSAQNFTYADIAGGIAWSFSKNDNKIIKHKAITANVGVAFYNLNRPKQDYLLTTPGALYFKYVFHGDFVFNFSNSPMGIAPAYILTLQGPSKQLLAGVSLKRYLNNDSKYTGIIKRSCFSYGVYYRLKDAAIINLLYEHHEQYAIGLSYDINISRLSPSSKTVGGLELLLRYTPPNAFLYQQKKSN